MSEQQKHYLGVQVAMVTQHLLMKPIGPIMKVYLTITTEFKLMNRPHLSMNLIIMIHLAMKPQSDMVICAPCCLIPSNI